MVSKIAPRVNLVFATALEVQSFCREQSWKFCFIGGVALQRWGEPRQTVDVDLTLLTGFGGEEVFIQKLLARFEPRRPDAVEFALRNRVLLLRNSHRIGLDIAFGALPFEESTVARASEFSVGDGQFIFTYSAEDLLIHKCFANRPQDWVDVENVLLKQHGRLNLALVFRELEPLLELKGEPQNRAQLERLIAGVDRKADQIRRQSAS